MKLISLYIENFGGLHQYRLNFEDGLTVVQQPNGFGKTTLAEFIRAMFYGFPRKAKSLDKSRRQKYTPWQGGKFGGNLIFEFEGSRYRIERTFGATPKSDTFQLIDPTTGKKSSRFSEEIGLELFRLDADSFERSTYMPQLHGLTSLTTDSIQAKLADLVEDTGDMGNYENAVTALKSARSAYIPYRGNGGSVAESQGQISRLQTQVDRTAALEGVIQDATLRIRELEELLIQLKDRQQDIRNRILVSSEAAAVAAAHREFSQLDTRRLELEQAVASLKARYPLGLPSEEALLAARQAVSDLALHANREPTPEDAEAEVFVAQNKARFEGRTPGCEALENCRREISRYHALITEARSIGLSEGEKALYEKLLPLSRSGKLESTHLDRLDAASRELIRTEQTMHGAAASQDDRAALEKLKLYFASGIPEEEEITRKKQALNRSEALRQEKSAALQSLAGIHPELPGIAVPFLAAGAAAGIGLGILLLLKAMTVYAVPALILGCAMLMGVTVTEFRRRRKNREQELQRRSLQQQISGIEAQIARTEQETADFVRRYTSTFPLSDALIEIRDNREKLQKLATQVAAATAKQRQLAAQAQTHRELLIRELGDSDFPHEILALRLAAGQFRDLEAEIEATKTQTNRLKAESDGLKEQITAFLGGYYPNPQPDEFHSLLSDLQRDSEAYITARDRLETAAKLEAQRLESANECERIIQTFFRDHGLTRQENLREQLLTVRDDTRDWANLTRLHLLALREAEAYAQTNRSRLEMPIPEKIEDPGLLSLAEEKINREIEENTALLLAQKQHLALAGEQFGTLPDLRDELEHWQARKQIHQHRAALLDDTLEFLEKARENLQNRYLGPVRNSFVGYMEQLMDEDGDRILLTPDLDVRLERSGQARELGYFSAGQTDTVMLCMRLALVDALFTDAKPFVILDDPFVNLDDRHTLQALELLKELAKDRQILYLVCNSSRNYR